MKTKILNMLNMQDAMNHKVNETWREADFPWYRAIWTECAEMLDHYGWKWWKHQKPDMQQVKLEIVDIWHFTLSAYLMRGLPLEQTADLITEDLNQPWEAADLRAAIEDLAKDAIETHSANIPIVSRIMQLAGLDFDDLYRTYIGKNVLNFFRQDNGYQEGHYQKIWDGREDNEHLSEILAALNPESPTFSDEIYQKLAAAYPVTKM
jgi:dimeric dUTPase (all-alpha-NTP-PPase superfamily)